MRKITQELFQTLLDGASIRPRIKREVRFTTSVAHLDDEAWHRTELLPISDRAGNKGVLLMQWGEQICTAAYEISRGITSSTGKAQPIICDFCRTWQTGSRSGSITLYKPGRDAGSISFLCCADLECSKHVRNLTSAAKTSRAQLREDLDNDQRIARLKQRLQEVSELLGLEFQTLE
jgi:hypothetical protein